MPAGSLRNTKTADTASTKRGRRRKVQTTRGLDNYPNVSGPDAEFVSDSGQEYKILMNIENNYLIK